MAKLSGILTPDVKIQERPNMVINGEEDVQSFSFLRLENQRMSAAGEIPYSADKLLDQILGSTNDTFIIYYYQSSEAAAQDMNFFASIFLSANYLPDGPCQPHFTCSHVYTLIALTPSDLSLGGSIKLPHFVSLALRMLGACGS